MTPAYTPLDGDNLHDAVALDSHCFPTPWGRPGFLEIFRLRENVIVCGTAAMVGQQLVGFAVFEHQRHRVTVQRLAVHPAFRRRGIAGDLLSRVEKLITAGRCRSGVWVPIPENSAAALGLMLARGYSGRGVQVGHYGSEDSWIFQGPAWMVDAQKARTGKAAVA